MTIVVNADDNTVEQVRKQLAKLVPIVSVHDFRGTAYVESDLMLLTVTAPPAGSGMLATTSDNRESFREANSTRLSSPCSSSTGYPKLSAGRPISRPT